MSQALYTSKTGIAAGQTQIDVIANNVANINTTAYKTANVTFSTLFSKTLSNGSAATTKGGGINPKQIGLGTQVASISRDFNTGSFQQTGVSSDLMISGNGYFVVQDGSKNQYLTRDGHFSLDSDGNLVTASGLKVCGTTSEYSTISANDTIRVPSLLNVSLSGTPIAVMSEKALYELNAADFNTGEFSVDVSGASQVVPVAQFKQAAPPDDTVYNYDADGDGATDIVYTKLDPTNIPEEYRQEMVDIFGTFETTSTYYRGDDGTYIKGEIPTAGNVTIRTGKASVSYEITDADINGTLKQFVDNVNNEFARQGYGTIRFAIVDGGLQLTNNSGGTLTVSDPQYCNFLSQTGLAEAIDSTVAGQTLYSSTVMNQSVKLGDSYNSATAAKRSDWAISESGILSAKYSDGSQLTVVVNDNGRTTWQYTTSENIIITGSGSETSDIDLTGSTLKPSNMVVQLATVVNDGGLIAEVDNLWTIGPNAGEFAYGMANGNGFGTLKSGGLEGSNVDMAQELSNMIMAQRAIQVNSRVFSTASSVLETLAYLGQ